MELTDDIFYSLHDLEDAISLGMVTRKDWNEHYTIEEKKHVFIACGLDANEVGDRFSLQPVTSEREPLANRCTTLLSAQKL